MKMLVLSLSLVIILSNYPQHVSATYGTDFYVGAMRNYRGITDEFLLYITTPSVSGVQFNVENTTGVITTGTVTSTDPAVINLPISLVTNDGLYTSRFNGIRIYSTTSGGVLSVLVVNKRIYTFGDYLALPNQDFQLPQYQYYAVSTDTLAPPSDNSLSEVLLVGNRDNTTVTVVPTQTVTVPQNIQDPNSSNIIVTAGSAFSFTIHRMQTFLIGAPLLDISGTSIVSDKPLTVVSGHECGNIPLVCCCQQLAEQIPPTVTWGKQFLLTPYANRSHGTYYKFVAAESQTTVTLTCKSNETFSNTTYLTFAGDVSIQYSGIGAYCHIVADKPLLVTQLGPGYSVDNGFGDPVISMVPPIDQYQSNVALTIPSFTTIVTNYVNIATTTKGPVYIDGQLISVTWNNISDSNNSTVGYGAQIPVNSSLNSTSHTITMQSEFSTLVYGFGDFHGYSYSTGIYLNQLVTNPLRLQPWYGNILGGVPILVSGPYFNNDDKIVLSFDDVIVNCSHVNRLTALCVTPFLTAVGKVNVKLYRNTFLYESSTSFYSIPSQNDVKVDIKTNEKFFTSGETLDVTWSSSSISDEADSKVDVRMYEVQQTSDGTFTHREVAVLATDLPNNGQATLTIPTSLTGSPTSTSGSVCSVNIFVQAKRTVSNALDSIKNKIGQWTDKVLVLVEDAVDDFLRQKCLEWVAMEPASIGQILLDSVTATAPCPPNSVQAVTENSGLIEDTNRELIAYFHPQAARCFRQRVATTSGSGNQCCYRSDGTLIVGPTSGGSVDKVAPTGNGFGYLRNVRDHFLEDVLPYIYCCKGRKSDCRKYYERRPSDDGSRYNPPVPACVYGDPHIVTLDLHKYTFNGKGEFTLIVMDDELFTLQGRMMEASDVNGADARGTVFTAVAAKQRDSDTVQFELESNNTINCLVNGDIVDFSDLSSQDFRNVTVSDSGNNTLSATFSTGAFLKVKAMNGFIAVLIVSLPDQFRGQTRGLMGNYNGDISDDLIPRGDNVSPLPLNSSLKIIHEQFGVTWIVDSDSSLFTYPFAKNWATFYHPSFVPVYETTFSDPSLEEKANQICGSDEFCKFDIATTERVEIGEATFTGGQNFEQLVNLSQTITCNPPCVHGACVSTDVCVCGEGYSGDTCDSIVTTSCSENPCNGGICQYHAGTYICTCQPELTGVFCEVSIPSTSSSNAGLIAGVTVSIIAVLMIVVTAAIVLIVLYLTRTMKKPNRNDATNDHIYEDMREGNDQLYEEMDMKPRVF